MIKGLINQTVIFFFIIFQLCLAENNSFEKLEDVIIFKQNGLYACFPNLFLDKNLMVIGMSTRITKSHYDMTGGSKRFTSNDQGCNWHHLDSSYIFPGYKNNEGNFVITVPKNWQEIKNTDLEKVRDLDIVIKKSNGKSWQATGLYQKILDENGNKIHAESLALPNHALLMGTNLSSYLRRNNGLRLLALHGKMSSRETTNQVIILRSPNDGKSWEFIQICDQDSLPNDLGLGEAALVETDSRTFVSMSRGTDGYLYSSISNIEGIEWSIPKKTNIWGHPANLLNIGNNRILCTYGYRRKPMGIRAIILDGKSLEPRSEEFILRNDAVGNQYDSGYPMTIQFADNTFFTCYYITLKDGITHVAGTKWRLN